MASSRPRGLSPNQEDYLETIWFLLQESSEAHAAEIAVRMGVTRASVTGALRALAARDLIHYSPYHAIRLTGEGEALARKVAGRHRMLKDFFRDVLGVPEGEAEEAACGMEHAAGDLVMERFGEFTQWLSRRDLVADGWSPGTPPKD